MRLNEDTMKLYTGKSMASMAPSWAPWVDWKSEEQPLMMTSSINPHIVLKVNEKDGSSTVEHATRFDLGALPQLQGLSIEGGLDEGRAHGGGLA